MASNTRVNESNTYRHMELQQMRINYTMTMSIPSEAAAVVTEYLGLLSWHGTWYLGWLYWWLGDCARWRDTACVKWCLEGTRPGEGGSSCTDCSHVECAHWVGNLSFTLRARKGGSFSSFAVRSSPNGEQSPLHHFRSSSSYSFHTGNKNCTHIN